MKGWLWLIFHIWINDVNYPQVSINSSTHQLCQVLGAGCFSLHLHLVGLQWQWRRRCAEKLVVVFSSLEQSAMFQLRLKWETQNQSIWTTICNIWPIVYIRLSLHDRAYTPGGYVHCGQKVHKQGGFAIFRYFSDGNTWMCCREIHMHPASTSFWTRKYQWSGILQGDKSLCFLGLLSTYQEHFGQQRIELGSSFYVASAGRSGFTLF